MPCSLTTPSSCSLRGFMIDLLVLLLWYYDMCRQLMLVLIWYIVVIYSYYNYLDNMLIVYIIGIYGYEEFFGIRFLTIKFIL